MQSSSNKKIIYWLLSGCFLVFAMVIVGGITRLTGSGLSITEWKVVTGTIPPMDDAQWNEAFDKYKQIPQYKLLNADFTLSDFKFIYFWEYIHRLIARLIGIVFIIPFIYFLIKKQIDKSLMPKLIIMFLLGAWQGFLGWYMVKSGLTENVRVSHIRLAIHLINAFITFGYIFWVALGLIYSRQNKSVPNKKFNRLSWLLLFIVTIQIVYGAFVAGTKAGHVFNTWPKMGEEWMASSVPYAFEQQGISSLFNNLASVQFIHRWLAIIVLGLSSYIFILSGKSVLSKIQIQAIKSCMHAIILQIILGIFTLLFAVPVWLGVLHQVGAFLIFASIIFLIFHFTQIKSAV